MAALAEHSGQLTEHSEAIGALKKASGLGADAFSAPGIVAFGCLTVTAARPSYGRGITLCCERVVLKRCNVIVWAATSPEDDLAKQISELRVEFAAFKVSCTRPCSCRCLHAGLYGLRLCARNERMAHRNKRRIIRPDSQRRNSSTRAEASKASVRPANFRSSTTWPRYWIGFGN